MGGIKEEELDVAKIASVGMSRSYEDGRRDTCREIGEWLEKTTYADWYSNEVELLKRGRMPKEEEEVNK